MIYKLTGGCVLELKNGNPCCFHAMFMLLYATSDKIHAIFCVFHDKKPCLQNNILHYTPLHFSVQQKIIRKSEKRVFY